jgi:ferrous iron transport protein B
MTSNGHRYNVIDVPGTYQLDPEAEYEKVAASMIESGDILINVTDSTNLERNLSLTLQLMEYAKPMILVLNLWDDARHKGISINARKLEEYLGLPVIATNGLTGEELELLQDKLSTVRPIVPQKLSQEERWVKSVK